jgi:hypothetical protein
MQDKPVASTDKDVTLRVLTAQEIEQIAGANLEAFPIFPR